MSHYLKLYRSTLLGLGQPDVASSLGHAQEKPASRDVETDDRRFPKRHQRPACLVKGMCFESRARSPRPPGPLAVFAWVLLPFSLTYLPLAKPESFNRARWVSLGLLGYGLPSILVSIGPALLPACLPLVPLRFLQCRKRAASSPPQSLRAAGCSAF